MDKLELGTLVWYSFPSNLIALLGSNAFQDTKKSGIKIMQDSNFPLHETHFGNWIS